MFLSTLFCIEADVMSPGITSAYYATLLIPSVASLCYIGESGRKCCLQPSAFSIYWIFVSLAYMKSQTGNIMLETFAFDCRNNHF